MAVVDSYSEANQDNYIEVRATHPSGDGDPSAGGQSLTGNGEDILSCKFYVQKVGSPGNCIARLYAHTGTFGSSSVPTGSALDSSDVVAGGDFQTSYALHEFTGFAGYTLVDGTNYCIVFECYDGTWDSSNKVYIAMDISSPSHGGNCFYYSSSAWSAYADYDVCFYVSYRLTSTPSASHALGLAPTASRLASYPRSASASLGSVASVLWNLGLSALTNLGLAPAASRAIAVARSSSASLGLAASVLWDLGLSALTSLGLAPTASRAIAIARTASHALGLYTLATPFLRIKRRIESIGTQRSVASAGTERDVAEAGTEREVEDF